MMQDFPVFDLTNTDDSASSTELCQQLSDCLQRTGCVLVKHPSVSQEDNDLFLDMMERYFAQATEREARPWLHYQVGLTPQGVETPRALVDTEMQAQIAALPTDHAAIMPKGPDVKCRFMWRVGPRPAATQYPELNADPVIPEGFPDWSSVMDSFGARMLAVANSVARCIAVGFGLPAGSLESLMTNGPHLLAPTGSDLAAHGQLGTVLAGYHSDLNLLTLHGKSRFPGLHVWLADGRRVAVRVPPGCLLVQAGQQLEWLTGGHVKAGFHEVVVSPDTRAAIESAAAAGRSLWRVSSTLFAHVASDAILQPLGHFATEQALASYPPTPTGSQVQKELLAISLKIKSPKKDSRSLGGNDNHVSKVQELGAAVEQGDIRSDQSAVNPERAMATSSPSTQKHGKTPLFSSAAHRNSPISLFLQP